jgi:hypothetical protein
MREHGSAYSFAHRFAARKQPKKEKRICEVNFPI